MGSGKEKAVPIKIVALTILGVAVISSVATYTLAKPDSDELDPRCDPLFIEKATSGNRQCNEAREQREYLFYLKNPNGR